MSQITEFKADFPWTAEKNYKTIKLWTHGQLFVPLLIWEQGELLQYYILYNIFFGFVATLLRQTRTLKFDL